MKKLIISMGLLLLLWLYWQDGAQRHPKKIKPINQVSLKTNTTESSKKTESIKQKLKARVAEVVETESAAAHQEALSEQDWSYLAIFRRLEWADVCGRYFWFAYRNKDKPTADFVAEFSKNDHSEQQDSELDPRAVEGLNRYQSRCEALQKAVFAYAQVDEMDGYKANTVAQELQNLLETTPAKTKKEKSIKAHAALTSAFYQARKNLNEAERQSGTISDEEKKRIYEEMRVLSEEMAGLTDRLDSQDALNSYEYLVVEIKKLDDQLNGQYDSNDEVYQAAWTQLLNQWVELQARLIGEDPDVFKMVKLASEWSSHIANIGMSISWYRNIMSFPLKSPGEQMMESFEIQAAYVFSEAANPAAVLYLCGLGYDCGADGSLAMQLCLMHYTAMPAACEVSVQDFYLNHALSPNLLEDVLTLYEWMEQNYGS